MQFRPLLWFVEWRIFGAVVGLECIQQQISQENFTEVVLSIRARTKAVKKGRKYQLETEYYEYFEEKVSQRNVTRNETTCCQGYVEESGKCLLKSLSSTTSDSDSGYGSASTVVVPVVILLLMLLVSIAIVHHLHSKDKPCIKIDRKDRLKKISEETTNRTQDEVYTPIRQSGVDSGNYADLSDVPIPTGSIPPAYEGDRADYTEMGHYDHLLTVVGIQSADEIKS